MAPTRFGVRGAAQWYAIIPGTVRDTGPQLVTEADGQLAPKTRFDAADRAKHYIRPVIGHLKVADVTPKVILEWGR
jgi:hypothetical protein